MVDPDGGLTTYSYDAAGRLSSQQNPFGETSAWTRDVLGRADSRIAGRQVTDKGSVWDH